MKNKFLKVIVVLSLITAFSCSQKSDKVETKQTGDLADLPSWVIDPAVEGTVAAVGIASQSTGGISFQIKKAELDAKANIAATIQSEISRVTKNALRSARVNDGEDVDDFFSQATKEVVKNFPLSGVKRINIYKDKSDGTLYVQMALSNEDYSKYLENSRNVFEERLKRAQMSRESINKSQEAVKSLFDELEKERTEDTAE